MPESQGEADDGNGSTKIEAAESIPSYSVSGREERESGRNPGQLQHITWRTQSLALYWILQENTNGKNDRQTDPVDEGKEQNRKAEWS